MALVAGASLVRIDLPEQIADGQRGAVCAVPFGHERPKRSVAFPLGDAQGTPVFRALALHGLQTLLRGRELLFEMLAGAAGMLEFDVPVCPVESFPLTAEHEADVEVRHAEADGDRQEEHGGGEDAGDGREFDEDRPAAEEDGAGADVDENELLQAPVGAQAEHDGTHDQG